MWIPNVYSDQPALTAAKTRSFSGNKGGGGDALEVATDELALNPSWRLCLLLAVLTRAAEQAAKAVVKL